MVFSEFIKTLPEDKRAIYQKVYDANFSNETNTKLAKRLSVPLNQIETVRHDLIYKAWIKPKKTQYRKQAGLTPLRTKKGPSEKKNLSATRGLKPGQTRHTFIIDEKNLENIRILAHLDQKNLNSFVNDLFIAYFRERKSDFDFAIAHRERSRNEILKIVKSK